MFHIRAARIGQCQSLLHLAPLLSTCAGVALLRRHRCYDLVHGTNRVQGPTIHSRGYHRTNPLDTPATGGGDGEDDFLAAYEDLVLNTDVEEGVGGALVVEEAANVPVTPELVMAEVTDLLPVDGTALRLTSLTPMLSHMEEICSWDGSLLAFLRRFPQHFVCEEAEGRRWNVRRPPEATTRPCVSVDTSPRTLPNAADLYAAEDREALMPTLGRVSSLRPHRSPAFLPCRGRLLSIATPSVLVDWAAIAEALPEGEVVPISHVRPLIPMAVLAVIRSSHRGIVRLLREQHTAAAAHVELSADGRCIARCGVCVLSDIPTWDPTCAAAAGGDYRPRGEAFPEPWEVELDLDGESAESMEDEAFAATCEPDEGFLSPLGERAVLYDGPTESACRSTNATRDSADVPLNWERLAKAPAPVQPSKVATAAAAASPGLGVKSKTPARPPPPIKKQPAVPRTLEELLAAHTAMALARGCRTPEQLLDLLVECIPSFPVPADQLVASDTLAKVIGPRKAMRRVVKAFPYYVAYDKETDTAHLLAGVQHPLAGQADVHYTAWNPKRSKDREGLPSTAARPAAGQRATTATSAFPVLKPMIRSSHKVPQVVAPAAPKAPPSPPPASASVFPSEEVAAVALSLPFDRYVSLEEAGALTGLSTPALLAAVNTQDDSALCLVRRSPWGVRLRPYELAPGSTGEAAETAVPPPLARVLRPAWSAISRLLARLSEDDRALVLAQSQRVAAASAGASCEGTVKEDEEVAFVAALLRAAGRCGWVDADGQRTRRYAASAVLDDVTHWLVRLLSRSASHEMLPLAEVLARASTVHGGRSGGLVAMAAQAPVGELHAFLKRHAAMVEVELRDDHSLWLRRTTSFISFSPPLPR